MEDGDVFLLCSDGLNTMLPDNVIEAELARGGSLKDMTERLIVRSNEQGATTTSALSCCEHTPCPDVLGPQGRAGIRLRKRKAGSQQYHPYIDDRIS